MRLCEVRPLRHANYLPVTKALPDLPCSKNLKVDEIDQARPDEGVALRAGMKRARTPG